MPNLKRAVSSAGRGSDKIVRKKPTPPLDLWARLEAEVAKLPVGKRQIEIPPGGFTARQFAEKFGLQKTSAGLRIRRLLEGGAILMPRTGPGAYYIFKK